MADPFAADRFVACSPSRPPRPRAVLIAGLLIAGCLAAALRPAPADAQSWSLYDTGGTSYAIQPTGSTDNRYNYDISLNVGATSTNAPVNVEMDTGSTGIVITADLISSNKAALTGSPGWAFYNSSGLLVTGVLTQATVTYRNTANNALVTASVPVLAVMHRHCLGVGGNSGNCSETGNIAMMGVGFGRNTLGADASTIAVNSMDFQTMTAAQKKSLAGQLDNAGVTPLAYNPLVNIDGGTSTFNQGYIIRDGKIEVGLNASNTSNFAYGKLQQTTDSQGTGNWTQAPMSVQVGANGPSSGVLLADTGVTDGFVHIPGAPQSGSLADGTLVTVQVLDAGSLVSYSFVVGNQCAQTPQPANCNPQAPNGIIWVSGSETASFLNSSIYFYKGFDYLFDPTNGYLGVMNSQRAGTTVTVTPVISALGQLDFANPFTTDMQVLLRGATSIAATTTATFNAALTGSGSLTLNGAGTVTLNGANTYTGHTTVESGTFAVTNALASAVTVRSGGMFDLSGRLAVSGSAAAVVTVDSGGMFDLSGAVTGAVSNYGITTVETSGTITGDVTNAGTFANNGTVTGTLTSTGRVQGTGTVTNLVVSDGGTLATGNSVGTMTVTGNYTFGPGATREVEVSADGTVDLLTVGGTATLAGGTVVAIENPALVPVLGASYVFLTAGGGVSGTHDTLVGGLFPDASYPFLTTGLSYAPTTASLVVTRSGVTYASAGVTDNQKSVGAALDSFVPGSALDLPLTHLTVAQYDVASDQLSGQIHASALTTLQNDATVVRSTVANRLEAAFAEMSGGPAFAANGAPAAPLPGVTASAWISAYGNWGDTDASFNASELTTSLAGTLGGIDAAIHDWGRVGLAAGYGASRFKAADLSASGTAGSTTIAAYGGAEFGRLRATLGGTWSWHDVETDRLVAFPGYSETNDADYSATTGQIFGEGSVDLGLAQADVSAFAGLAFVSTTTDSFSEGTGLTALSGGGDTQSNTLSTLGLRIARLYPVGGGWLRPHATLGWQHAFGDVEPEADLAFSQSGAAFTVIGAPIARDAAVVGAGLDFSAFQSAEVSVRYDGRIGSGTQEHSASGHLSFTF
ncbi:autotransporter outer membrane beta-barrel domain-containing protein [Amorphus suaedae]